MGAVMQCVCVCDFILEICWMQRLSHYISVVYQWIPGLVLPFAACELHCCGHGLALILTFH